MEFVVRNTFLHVEDDELLAAEDGESETPAWQRRARRIVSAPAGSLLATPGRLSLSAPAGSQGPQGDGAESGPVGGESQGAGTGGEGRRQAAQAAIDESQEEDRAAGDDLQEAGVDSAVQPLASEPHARNQGASNSAAATEDQAQIERPRAMTAPMAPSSSPIVPPSTSPPLPPGYWTDTRARSALMASASCGASAATSCPRDSFFSDAPTIETRSRCTTFADEGLHPLTLAARDTADEVEPTSPCSPFSTGSNWADYETVEYSGPKTTVMMRNIPVHLSRDQLMALIDAQGFFGSYDFFYLPIDFGTETNFGYCFINLVNPEVALRFWDYFQGFGSWGGPTDVTLEISWSAKHQGWDANIARYRNCPVMFDTVADECRPVVLQHGVRVAFPPPTKKVRQPRVRPCKLKKGVDSPASSAPNSPVSPARSEGGRRRGQVGFGL